MRKWPRVFWARTGDKSHPKGGQGNRRPLMRNVPKALFGSLSDQKKFVRSIVVPHSEPAGWEERTLPMSVKEGREGRFWVR